MYVLICINDTNTGYLTIKKIVKNFSLYNLFKKIIKIHEVIDKYKIQE